MISGLIKKIIPVRIKAFIRMGKERKNFSNIINQIENDKGNYDLLIGTPIHTNLGDHLITLAEQQLFQKLNPDRKVYDIPTEVYQFYRKRLTKSIKNTSRVFINGGGWMGNLWPNEEKLLQDMVNSFKRNKIVIFPQTIFYDEQIKPYQELIDRGNNIIR